MEKKNCFVLKFKSNKKICSSLSEAVEFIETIKDLAVNDYCRNKLVSLFNGDSIYTISTTGCGNDRIEITPALADTIEEHDRIVEDNYRSFKQKEFDSLNLINKGHYLCSLPYTLGKKYHNLELTVMAESKHEAYILCCNEIVHKYGHLLELNISDITNGFQCELITENL